MDIIQAINIKKFYHDGPRLKKALDGINLKILPGTFTAVTGPPGSGKSALLHIIGGLDQPSCGHIRTAGVQLTALNEEQLAVYRRRNIGYVLPHPGLLPMFTVYDNIVFPLRLDQADIDTAYIGRLTNFLGLSPYLHCRIHTLSPEDMQKTVIARAMAVRPAVVLADEPAGRLEQPNHSDIYQLLESSQKEFGHTLIIASDNPAASQGADRIIRLENGRLIRDSDNSG